MLIYLLSFLFMFLAGLWSFSLKNKHLLLMLLSMEFIIMSLYYLLFMYLLIEGDCNFSMIFLSMVVCEGALGISILVSIVRTHGNDHFNTFSILW
uniref:NADH-ubiquinone oxidoreductase chain 4L n=1 Tax=Ptilodactylidae sp. 2 ACP-2013 TaxID=1434563 RepID=A0A3G5FNP2_9COLE|nr:NADH dehydrogenase subunit 4L [Ptilodactylidae sp. 2 ACP-2013]